LGRGGHHSTDAQDQTGEAAFGLVLFQAFQFSQDGLDDFTAAQEPFLGTRLTFFLCDKGYQFIPNLLGWVGMRQSPQVFFSSP